MEEIKNFWNAQPCNIKHSEKTFLSKEFFDEIDEKRYFVEPHIKDFARFEDWKGKKVLEIGCGIGTDAVNFVKNGALYVGIDLSDKSIDIAEKRFKVYGLIGNFYCLDSENINSLEKVGNDFDLIYSFGVIHHSPDSQTIIDNCYKLLKSGGIIKVMVYAKNSWKKIMIEEGYDRYEAQNNCPLAKTYTNGEVLEMFGAFDNIDIFQDHIFPYKIPEYKKNIYKKEEWFEYMPDEIFNIFKKRLGWHICVTAQKK